MMHTVSMSTQWHAGTRQTKQSAGVWCLHALQGLWENIWINRTGLQQKQSWTHLHPPCLCVCVWLCVCQTQLPTRVTHSMSQQDVSSCHQTINQLTSLDSQHRDSRHFHFSANFSATCYSYSPLAPTPSASTSPRSGVGSPVERLQTDYISATLSKDKFYALIVRLQETLQIILPLALALHWCDSIKPSGSKIRSIPKHPVCQKINFTAEVNMFTNDSGLCSQVVTTVWGWNIILQMLKWIILERRNMGSAC